MRDRSSTSELKVNLTVSNWARLNHKRATLSCKWVHFRLGDDKGETVITQLGTDRGTRCEIAGGQRQ